MRKTLQELTLKDNFMFGAVMAEEENCKPLLEMILGFPIERVEISKEHSLVYHPEYRGIRMDVYAKDNNNTRYNVEMQAIPRGALPKRARYYHSQLDMDLLVSGTDYNLLSNVYVIFVCNFDPFGEKRYCYRFENRCLEDDELSLGDGNYSIFLSTKGENPTEISPELRHFLEFLSMDLKKSEMPSEDAFVAQLQKAIQRIKKNREMEGRYMWFELLLDDEHKAGRQEGLQEGLQRGFQKGRQEALNEQILDFLNDLGPIPQELTDRITEENSLEEKKCWLKLSARASSIEEFQEKMDDAILHQNTTV